MDDDLLAALSGNGIIKVGHNPNDIVTEDPSSDIDASRLNTISLSDYEINGMIGIDPRVVINPLDYITIDSLITDIVQINIFQVTDKIVLEEILNGVRCGLPIEDVHQWLGVDLVPEEPVSEALFSLSLYSVGKTWDFGDSLSPSQVTDLLVEGGPQAVINAKGKLKLSSKAQLQALIITNVINDAKVRLVELQREIPEVITVLSSQMSALDVSGAIATAKSALADELSRFGISDLTEESFGAMEAQNQNIVRKLIMDRMLNLLIRLIR